MSDKLMAKVEAVDPEETGGFTHWRFILKRGEREYHDILVIGLCTHPTPENLLKIVKRQLNGAANLTFKEWCVLNKENNDSRSAERRFNLVKERRARFDQFFTADELPKSKFVQWTAGWSVKFRQEQLDKFRESLGKEIDPKVAEAEVAKAKKELGWE